MCTFPILNICIHFLVFDRQFIDFFIISILDNYIAAFSWMSHFIFTIKLSILPGLIRIMHNSTIENPQLGSCVLDYMVSRPKCTIQIVIILMLRHLTADRQGKKWFHVFYDPIIVKFMDIFIKFLITWSKIVHFVFLTTQT